MDRDGTTEPAFPAPGGPPPAPPAPTAPQGVTFAPEFTGTGAEYFRVWIVNVALTIVTLGIYSAWAKVRNKQYFYGNTVLAGGSFEYTANPVNILKGRLLVLGVLAAYTLAESFNPVVAIFVALGILPFVPWVVVKSVSFNLRYSSYRGLAFHFDGRYWEAFRLYILWTLGIVASFGLLYPYVAFRRKQFLVDRSRYGRAPFHFSGEVGWFYVVYIIASIAYTGLIVGGMVILTGVIAAAAALAGGDDGDFEKWGKGAAIGGAIVMYVVFLLVFVLFNAGIQAMISNHVWQRTRVADVTFDLQLNLWRILWIQGSNMVAIIFSVGMLIPWAKVRMIRYSLSCFSMQAVPSDLEQFVASERDRVEATGAEFGDALDLDLGL